MNNVVNNKLKEALDDLERQLKDNEVFRSNLKRQIMLLKKALEPSLRAREKSMTVISVDSEPVADTVANVSATSNKY